jgi:SAM-dependent methyltransferase
MKITEQNPPRVFRTGRAQPIDLRDCARIQLAADEQVTFVTESGAEYDVARKVWGFYATPSLNGRLRQFGLRAALVKNFIGKFYVFLVEDGREEACLSYLASEDNVLVRWLDTDESLSAIPAESAADERRTNDLHCMCGADRFRTVHMYFEPPSGEVALHGWANPYRRELFECGVCRHVISVHAMDLSRFYEGDYVDATYGGVDGMQRQFDRIMALPVEKSDNSGRAARVTAFADQRLGGHRGRTLLDVGSGLGVFVAAMKRHEWHPTALDPDERAVQHARDVAGISAVRADFMDADRLGTFDVVTFNKVLEHIKDPVRMLARARTLLHPSGFVYIEVPDAEHAAADPDRFGREEFFIEHHHVFSYASAALLTTRAGFEVLAIERLREPSSKYTLRLFAAPRSDAARQVEKS